MSKTASYMTQQALPAYVAEMLYTHPAKLTRDQVFALADDAVQRDSWDLAGRHAHVKRVCSLLGEWDVKLRAMMKQLEACLEECVRIQAKAAELSLENRHLRLALPMWAVQVAVAEATGKETTVASDIPEKIVVDMDHLDGIAVDRTPTEREAVPSSAEVAAQYGEGK